jgi:hypothetical protein
MRVLFSGPSQHLTSTTRQTSYAVEFEIYARDTLGGVLIPCSRHSPQQLSQIFACARQVQTSQSRRRTLIASVSEK